MKSALKATFCILILGLVVCGCQQQEDPFVDQGVGIWDILSRNIKIYENGTLTTDETRTDSLGQFQFERSGQGYVLHADAKRDTITWEECLSEQRLIMYRKTGPFMNASISKRTDNSMRLFWVNESDEGALHRRTETTMDIQRRR
jgi:hypothetical protein